MFGKNQDLISCQKQSIGIQCEQNLRVSFDIVQCTTSSGFKYLFGRLIMSSGLHIGSYIYIVQLAQQFLAQGYSPFKYFRQFHGIFSSLLSLHLSLTTTFSIVFFCTVSTHSAFLQHSPLPFVSTLLQHLFCSNSFFFYSISSFFTDFSSSTFPFGFLSYVLEAHNGTAAEQSVLKPMLQGIYCLTLMVLRLERQCEPRRALRRL